jgi:hypothetical protein
LGRENPQNSFSGKLCEGEYENEKKNEKEKEERGKIRENQS